MVKMANFMANFVKKAEPIADKTERSATPDESSTKSKADSNLMDRLDDAIARGIAADAAEREDICNTITADLRRRWSNSRHNMRPARLSTVFDAPTKRLVVLKYLAVRFQRNSRRDGRWRYFFL